MACPTKTGVPWKDLVFQQGKSGLQPNLPPNSGGNGVLNNYSDCHGYIHAYSDCHGHIHTNAYGDSYIYAYGYSHGNCDSNSNADRDAVAAAYTYATASADTAASALALSGTKETRAKQTREFPASKLFKKLDRRRSRPLQGVRSAS